jgi:2,4-didehydro-3-deoxy-L-rhamnonate hydrolase
MPLNILHFSHQGRSQWGVVRQGTITPIPGEFATTAMFLHANDIASLAALQGPTLHESEVRWLSPVTPGQQFICQGANYRQHMIESGMNPDAKHYNMIFTKAPSCIVAADADVLRPTHVRFLDYEIELGLVLKRDILSRQTVAADNLHQYVAGIVIVNDYSARDIQIPQMQFYKGKSYRTFGPVGPYLCLLEPADIPLLASLKLTLTVNGQVRQQDVTANLVHGPAETLTELSGVHDLFTGDLIATGTPAGCALSIPSPAKQRIAALFPEAAKWKMFMKVQATRPQYLQPGDLVEAHIASRDGTIDLGMQRNCIKEAT